MKTSCACQLLKTWIARTSISNSHQEEFPVYPITTHKGIASDYMPERHCTDYLKLHVYGTASLLSGSWIADSLGVRRTHVISSNDKTDTKFT